jgi:hypothetical protein
MAETKKILEELSTSPEARESFLDLIHQKRLELGENQALLEVLTEEFKTLKSRYPIGAARAKSSKALRLVRVLTQMEADKLKFWEMQEILRLAAEGVRSLDDPRLAEHVKSYLAQKRAETLSAVRAIFTRFDTDIQERRCRQSFVELQRNLETELKIQEPSHESP